MLTAVRQPVLTPAPTAVLDKFQYLHFSVAPKCSRLNRGRLNMEQSSCFVLQKETVPHPQNILSTVTWSLLHGIRSIYKLCLVIVKMLSVEDQWCFTDVKYLFCRHHFFLLSFVKLLYTLL